MSTGLRPIRSDSEPHRGRATMWDSRTAAVTTNIAPAPSSVTFLRYVGHLVAHHRVEADSVGEGRPESHCDPLELFAETGTQRRGILLRCREKRLEHWGVLDLEPQVQPDRTEWQRDEERHPPAPRSTSRLPTGWT